MIVLVNDRQRERLKKLSSASDRYEREVETGKKQQRRRVANAVPEPHEWALMALGLLLLLYTAVGTGPRPANSHAVASHDSERELSHFVTVRPSGVGSQQKRYLSETT